MNIQTHACPRALIFHHSQIRYTKVHTIGTQASIKFVHNESLIFKKKLIRQRVPTDQIRYQCSYMYEEL